MSHLSQKQGFSYAFATQEISAIVAVTARHLLAMSRLTVRANCEYLGRLGRKPGSVRGRLSLWDDGYPPPLAVLQYGTGKRPTLVPPPCSHLGFTEPVPHDTAGALLPHLCTLACTDKSQPSAVCFCGTFRTVACPGRYPAGLVFREPGLSSDAVHPQSPHLLSPFPV